MDRNYDLKESIQEMINDRLSRNETYNCLFDILLLNKEKRLILEDLLLRNGYNTYAVDTVSGCWNLNDGWYELDNVKSIVEYCGVYPVEWNIDDVVLLVNMYYDRDIYINVLWKEQKDDGKIEYIPNN